MKLPIWPDSLPATFTRSVTTPGTVRSSAHGSRDVGIASRSMAVIVAAVPMSRASMSGDAAVTVTSCSTPASCSATGTSTLAPTIMVMCVRVNFANPPISTVIWYSPGSTSRNRKLPSAVVTNVDRRDGPASVTVAPGTTPPWLSFTTPVMRPLSVDWAAAGSDAQALSTTRSRALRIMIASMVSLSTSENTSRPLW